MNSYFFNDFAHISPPTTFKGPSHFKTVNNVHIWYNDTYSKFTESESEYYINCSEAKHSNALLLVFDLTSRKSFEKIDFYVDIMKKYKYYNDIILLVGTKCDLSDKIQITNDEADLKADHLCIKYWEVSALTQYNVNEMFDSIINYMLDKKKLESQIK